MSRKVDKERAKGFLKEYYKICTKYGIAVDATEDVVSCCLMDIIEFEKETIKIAKARGIPVSETPDVKGYVILSIEQLMEESGFTREEIKDFIRELTKET